MNVFNKIIAKIVKSARKLTCQNIGTGSDELSQKIKKELKP